VKKDLLFAQKFGLLHQVIFLVFAFTGPGGFTNADGIGDAKPIDTIGGIQIELSAWNKRKPGKEIIEEINSTMNI
jgi:hypothetical protein